MHTIGPLDLVVVGLAAFVIGIAPWAQIQDSIQNFRDSLSSFSAPAYFRPEQPGTSGRQPAQTSFQVAGVALMLFGLLQYFFG